MERLQIVHFFRCNKNSFAMNPRGNLPVERPNRRVENSFTLCGLLWRYFLICSARFGLARSSDAAFPPVQQGLSGPLARFIVPAFAAATTAATRFAMFAGEFKTA
jgi:hypothetical protein